MQKPNKLYIEEKIKYHPFKEKILYKLAPIPIEFVDDYRKIGEEKRLLKEPRRIKTHSL